MRRAAATVTGLPTSVVPTSNWTAPGAADGAIVAVRVSWFRRTADSGERPPAWWWWGPG